MSKKDFDDFINKQKKPSVDTDKKEEWLKYINDFYSKVENFLSEYVKSDKVSLQTSEKNITGKDIGDYTVKVLDIILGEHTVRLEPIGTDIIGVGVKGRIDLIGENGRVKFLLKLTLMGCMKYAQQVAFPEESLKPIELEWTIATPPPKIEYISLNQEVFLEALLEVIGG